MKPSNRSTSVKRLGLLKFMADGDCRGQCMQVTVKVKKRGLIPSVKVIKWRHCLLVSDWLTKGKPCHHALLMGRHVSGELRL